MKHLGKAFTLVLVNLFSFSAIAQVVFEPINDVIILDGELQYSSPWGGGLNSAQYSKADLDGDTKEELIIYDRSGRVFQIFKEQDQSYVPANELCVLLPEIPDGWVLFVDYDSDGKKDIFSNGDRGIVVYQNISEENQAATWRKVADPLLTTGFSGKINLIANAADVPAITDIDSDGDVDILVYNFAIGGYIRYNKNLSVEMYGHADSLEYEITTRAWGQFEECDCNLFAFSGETCDDLSNGRVMHPGGKALLAFDSDGDGDKDLLVGHEQCIELYFYENMGDLDSAYMVDFSNMFPDATKPANFHIFPAAYFEDLDFDGIRDLVVTPSFEENVDFKIDFANSNWMYKNVGSNENPNFEFSNGGLLQEDQVDLGEYSVPALYDINASGTIDLIVAANGFWNGENYTGFLTVFQNTGTPEEPAFTQSDDDYLNLSSLELTNPSVQFVDFTGDSVPDLLYSGYELASFEPRSILFPNQASPDEPARFLFEEQVSISLPRSATINDVPTYFDVDEDGYPDLLLAKRNGALEYYRNKADDSFELIDDAFLGIERDFSQERLNLVASIADLDNDDRADLLVTDATGAGRVYFQFQEQMSGNTTAIPMVYENEISEQEVDLKFDAKSWLATADLYDQGTESIISGGLRGGLQFFRNTSVGSPGDNPNELDVKLYPNPLFDTDLLNIRANQDVTVEVVSVIGQLLKEPFSLNKFTGTVLDIGNLSNGPYILRTISKSGTSKSQLFIIHR